MTILLLKEGWEPDKDTSTTFEKICEALNTLEEDHTILWMGNKGISYRAIITKKKLLSTAISMTDSSKYPDTYMRVFRQFEWQRISGIEEKGKNKGIVRVFVKKHDRKGNPQLDRKGEFKVVRLEFKVKKHKDDDKNAFRKRQESFFALFDETFRNSSSKTT
ncbi:MAG: hypothetical protein ACXABI_16930 [Candidatus Hodarchaeales archaeon]|jgi:hypothetical protein